jgi:amino acid permease
MSCIFWALFMFPLSLPREINSLRYASFIGITAILYLVASIVIHSAMNGVEHHSHAIKEVKFGTDMLLALPLCMFSFCCQPNVFEIYVEMKNKSRIKMTKTAGYAMTVSTSLYIIAGVFGYADFGSSVKSNILKNYHPLHNYMMAVAFFAISFTVTMAFPLCIFPTRDAILHILKYQDVHHTPTKVRVLISGLLAVGALILGLLIPNIVVIFGFLGGLCGSMIGFILPAWFALRTEGFTVANVGKVDYYMAIILLVFGIVSGILGTAVSIYQTVE